MKTLMRVFITFFFLLVFNLLSGQEFNGIAIYKTFSKMNMTMDSTAVSSDEQKALNEIIRKSMQKEYELRFNQNESIYKLIETLDKKDSSNNIEVIGLGSGTEGGLYKNIKNLNLIENRDVFGKLFLVKDKLEEYDWKLSDETKLVGDYLCYKAVANIKTVIESKNVDEAGIDNEIEKVILRKITAWYTPQIPINNGPASYWGLPGLILELDNENLSMICSKIIINSNKEINIIKPNKGKVVSDIEYKKIFKQKVKELQEMYKNNRKINKN